MTILKNEPIFNFEDGDYCKPHHIIVKGSWKEIGFDLLNVKADLSKPEIHVRWYLGDAAPVPGTNHMEDAMSEFHTFGF